MRTLAPTRVRSSAYCHTFREYVGVCRICGDCCAFAGDDTVLDRKDALAWCYGHLAVFHEGWRGRA